MPIRQQLARLTGRQALARRVAELERQLLQIQQDNGELRAERDAVASELESMYHPPILINTLPKSGSVYIINTLQRGLGTHFEKIGRGTFPYDHVNGPALAAFSNRRAVTQEHLDGSAYNQRLLSRHLKRIVVHLRDPRAAALSWMHHLTGLIRNRRDYEYAAAHLYPGDDFSDQPEAERMQWIVDHHFPACIEWISGWLEAADAGPLAESRPEILITHYEAFTQDPDAFFARILGFFEVAPERFRRVLVERSKAMNFRKAQSGEWREQPDHLCRAMTDSIPDEWFERFGWER